MCCSFLGDSIAFAARHRRSTNFEQAVVRWLFFLLAVTTIVVVICWLLAFFFAPSFGGPWSFISMRDDLQVVLPVTWRNKREMHQGLHYVIVHPVPDLAGAVSGASFGPCGLPWETRGFLLGLRLGTREAHGSMCLCNVGCSEAMCVRW